MKLASGGCEFILRPKAPSDVTFNKHAMKRGHKMKLLKCLAIYDYFKINETGGLPDEKYPCNSFAEKQSTNAYV